MNISSLGQSSVKLTDKNFEIVINPNKPEKQIGENTISISTNFEKFDRGRKSLYLPGEYELCDVYFEGIEYDNKTTLFTFQFNGVNYCHLDNVTDELTSSQIENLGQVDVLFINAGSTPEETKKSHILLEQIEASVVIPCNYTDDGAAFMKETGQEMPEIMKTFKVKSRSSLPTDKTEFVFLEN